MFFETSEVRVGRDARDLLGERHVGQELAPRQRRIVRIFHGVDVAGERDGGDHQPTFRTTLPVTSRFAIFVSASAARSSGNVAEMCGFSLPSAYQRPSWRIDSANFCGSRRVNSPQYTPTIEQPLSSVRLSGIFGMSPAAKPTTRSRPRQA